LAYGKDKLPATNKITVNGRCFSRRVTGVERYAHEISKRMEPSPRIIAPQKMLAQVSGHLWEQFILPAQVHNDEVLWSPANTSAWTVRKQAVTIHDASVFDHPEWFHPAFVAWTRLSWKILANRVKVIITVSEFSRTRLKLHLAIPEHKIHVIPNGVGKPFEPQTKRCINEIREKYNLKKTYFLFVGTLQPRKNFAGLFESFIKLAPSKYTLAIAGEKGRVYADSEVRIEKSLQGGYLTHIQFLGYVPDAELPALYSGAAAVIVPSLYEGSGLTALEAMACGAPVIASNTTSFPEVIGDAALFVNPDHVEEIANAMQKIIEDPYLSNTLRESGFQRAAEFTWDESAHKTQSLLEKL
jgi:glycosyltransferase involved in cell wall biosynthesis